MQTASIFLRVKFPGVPVDSRGVPVDFPAFSRATLGGKNKTPKDFKGATCGWWQVCGPSKFMNGLCRLSVSFVWHKGK